jgi:hypothetical protein
VLGQRESAMAQNAVTQRDDATNQIERVEQVLSDLEIEVSVGRDGRYTVCTHSEPLFCFVRDSEEEIDTVVIDTLTSYLNTFYSDVFESIEVTAGSVPLEVSSIPIEELTPVSGIRPTFSVRDKQGRRREFA